ncbi:hypothetical protein ACFYZB_44990 [Streptomyces sp. NPDC001852]|uniref:hypothetical protein n=1 Tax=Streptomyces sp. NPDC001852 TaxID=3364619 RepID=UPI0036B2ACE7
MSGAWQPYPDTEETLRALHGRGIPVPVVSNIGWDMRRVFRDHGVDDLVDASFLSFAAPSCAHGPAPGSRNAQRRTRLLQPQDRTAGGTPAASPHPLPTPADHPTRTFHTPQ